VDFDQPPAIGKLVPAGLVQELDDTGIGEDIAEALRRHVG
jgi:hypothetical protein